MSEPRRWTLIDQSESFSPRWTVTNQDRAPAAREYAEQVEVMPVAEHEQLVAALRIDLQDRLTVAEDALAGNPLDVVL